MVDKGTSSKLLHLGWIVCWGLLPLQESKSFRYEQFYESGS
jgi:hypothetical protein